MEAWGSKLKEIRSAVSSSVSSTVFSTISTVKDVLPGNPVTRDFEVNEHVASGGPGLLWKIYSGSKKSTKQPAAIFVLEKRQLDQKFPDKHEREALLDQFRKSIAQLTRLRHPQILTVQHPLEESRDSLAFATEPVYASLANVIGRHENLPSPVPTHLRDYKLFDVEIKYGMLQLCEGLTFLHESVKMLHRGISPDNIILNHQGAWKIFGFDFSLQNSSPQGVTPSWEHPMVNEAHLNDCCRPDLDFMAPEHGLDRDSGYKLTSASDMFSLGMVAFTLYNTKPLFTNCGSWSSFKKNAAELKSLRESNLQLIPAELKSSLKLLLNVSQEIRPTAGQLAQIQFFEDVGVKTLNSLDSQFQWDNLQKSQFYKGLPHVLPRLPHRVALNRVVPCLAKEYVNHQMVPFVLPSVLYIAEEASKSDFATHILPDLKQVMKITDPVQVLLIFMQKMEMLLSKTPPADVKSDVLPMIYRALEADTAQIQELCLSIIPGFAGLLEFQATKQALLPRIKKLCINTNLLSVRVNCLVCIGKLLQHLDKWLVLDDVFPMLQQIPSREPAVIMGIIGIYKLTLSDNKLGMTKEIIATKVLPFLFPLSIENGLTVSQYSAIMGLVRELINKVEEEHREKLQQLSSLKSEQKSALQVSMSENLKPDQLISTPQKQSEMDNMFSGLGLGDYVSQKDTGAVATGLMQTEKSSVAPISNMTSPTPITGVGQSVGLTLQQKEKIFQDAERNREWSSKSALEPMSTQPNKRAATGAKDLTSSLINDNLNQMKTSQTFSSMGSMGTSNPSPNCNWGTSNFRMGGINAQQTQQQHKPDLSSFDSILPMKPRQSQPMNSMLPLNSPPMSSMSPQLMVRPNFSDTNQYGTTGIMQPTSFNRNVNGASKPPVKSLTASDISDFLK